MEIVFRIVSICVMKNTLAVNLCSATSSFVVTVALFHVNKGSCCLIYLFQKVAGPFSHWSGCICRQSQCQKGIYSRGYCLLRGDREVTICVREHYNSKWIPTNQVQNFYIISVHSQQCTVTSLKQCLYLWEKFIVITEGMIYWESVQNF